MDAIREKEFAYIKQREEQVAYRLRVDETSRRELVTSSNTLHASSSSVAAGALVWGRGGTLIAEGAAAALEKSITSGLQELARIAAIRAGQTLSVSLSALLYSEPLANGELTAEQRRRLFQGVSVRASALGVPPDVDLPALAAAQGTVKLATRIKSVPVSRGTELRGVSTGGTISAGVPVLNAVFDPVEGVYRAHTAGVLPKYVVIGGEVPVPAGQSAVGLATGVPEIDEIHAGVDADITDCVVCFPADSGLAPQYYSFSTLAPDAGVVVGTGETAPADWWRLAAQERSVVLPAQVGERLRYRAFSSVEAFDKTLWRVIAEDQVLGQQFDEINRKRMSRGFAPYAPKASWVGERREFEIRGRNAANDARLFDLDQLSISRPNSDYGFPRGAPSFVPWPASNGSTWTPLVPPGSESLGPTELPSELGEPAIYPGDSTDPVGSQNETLLGAEADDINANIPGYGDDDDLPSPDLVIAGPPVEPLEVGDYNLLARRSLKDGLDIDHIVSRAALAKYILKGIDESIDASMKPRDLKIALDRAPSIAIPASVHQKFSETYGGRNTPAKSDLDASDLRLAVDSNFDALKRGLLEEGFAESEIEIARKKLHKLHSEQGWYE